MVRYEVKFGKDQYRLARVVDTRRDGDGLVRTAWVGMRCLRRAVREPADVCRAGLTMVELPVQRLVLLLPPEEQPEELLEGLAAFPPMPRGRIVERPLEQQDAEAESPPASPVRAVAPPPVAVQQPEAEAEILDIPRPQRVPRPRGRPRRGQ